MPAGEERPEHQFELAWAGWSCVKQPICEQMSCELCSHCQSVKLAHKCTINDFRDCKGSTGTKNWFPIKSQMRWNVFRPILRISIVIFIQCSLLPKRYVFKQHPFFKLSWSAADRWSLLYDLFRFILWGNINLLQSLLQMRKQRTTVQPSAWSRSMEPNSIKTSEVQKL